MSHAVGAVRALRAFARAPGGGPRCDFCPAAVTDRHGHVVDPVTRELRCTCASCAILFDAKGATKLRSIPRRTERLADFRMTDAAWEATRIPIAMAFFVSNSTTKSIVALFPSPAGTTESALSSDIWEALVADNSILATLAPDVEALLIHRARGARDHYIVSIDQCYELTARIRMHWRGFGGGPEVWSQISLFFENLRGSSRASRA